MYLNACEKFGISTYEMFTVPDLYERKMMSAVSRKHKEREGGGKKGREREEEKEGARKKTNERE